MKYRRLLVIITCLIFVTVAFFCVTSAFKVKDIELSVTTIENSNENVKELAADYLEQYENKNLLFTNVKTIEQDLKGLSGYLEVESVKKQFPNKISVVLKERREAFAIKCGSEYFIVNSDFVVLEKRVSSLNNIDNNPNVIVNLSLADYNYETLNVGDELKFYDSVTNEYFFTVAESLYNLRENLAEVTVSVKKDGFYSRTLSLKMREGVMFNIENANEHFALKLQKTMAFYSELPLKTAGIYYVVYEDGGSVTVKS